MVVVLERQLHAVKINEGDAVQGAFDQLRDLYVKLSAVGVDYPEKIKKELTAAAGEGGGSAYGMKGFKGHRSKKGKAKEGSGGEQYSGGKRSNKGGKRCGGKCWYCHVEGHPWFKCRKLPDGWRPGQPSIEGSKGVHGAMGEGMGSEEGDGGAGGHGGMFYHVGEASSEDMVVPASKVALHRSSHWVIDTGAYMTMTNREDLLDEVRPSEAATVVSATGQVVPVRGEGRAMFMGADGRLVGLKRVLLVPGLCANLLSTKALSEAGMKMEMMGTKVFKATLDGRVLWDLRGGKDMHRSMWEIPVLPWKEAAARLAAEAVRGGHASHVTSGGGGDGSDGGLLVHGGGALPSVTPSTGETDWLTAHRSFGHVALPQLQQLFKEERVKGLRIKGEPKEVGSCETCLTSKFSRFPFHSAVGKSSDPVELVHVDLVGPMKVKGDGGALYSMTMVDDYTRLTCDRGGEFLGVEFRSWLKRHGIKQQLTSACTPQSNGVAERANRTIIEGGRMILVDSGLPLRFWPLAIRHATVIKNRVLTHVGGQHWVPMEKWSGKKPLVDMLRVFGCMGLMHVPKEKRDKLQAVAVWAVHLEVSHDLGGAEGEAADLEEVLQQGEALVAERGDTEEEVQQPTPSPKLPPMRTTQGKCDAICGGAKEGAAKERPKRAAHPRDFLKYERLGVPKALLVQEEEYEEEKGAEGEMEQICCFGVNLPHEPASMEEALAGDDREAWLASRENEFMSHMENETWTLTNLPPGRKALDCTWVLRQREGIDIQEVFAPVAKAPMLRLLLAAATVCGWKVEQMDVKTAFLYGVVDEEIYMKQPEGYDDGSGRVCRLNKAIYGLKQAPKCWYARLVEVLEALGFKVSGCDESLFMTEGEEEKVFLLVYVDDILLFSPSLERIKEVQGKLKKTFQCKALGPGGYYLGLHVERDEFTRYPFSSSEEIAMAPLDEVVMDEVGPLNLGAAGAEYFLTMTWVYRYKSRLVAKGYQQKEKVDYKELFAPVVKPTRLRTLLAGSTIKGWVVKQMDITTAFTNGILEEEIFMAQLEGFDDGSGRVWKLKKALYRLKQAPRQWYLKEREVLEEIGFTPSSADHSLFMLGEGEQRSFMVVYVDDIIIFSPSSELVKEVMLKLQDKFKCKALGDVSFYLGLHIERDVEKRCMRVHQRKYLGALAASFGQSEGHVATPFPSGFKCVKGPEEESVGEEERRRFHSLVGSLMYAVVNTRPDVSATGQFDRVVQCPNEEQVAAGMRVAKYLGHTGMVGLQYSAAAQRRQKGVDGVEPGHLFLTTFSDASYASEPENMTNLGGFICYVGGGPTSWESKKQVDQALSSVESEYMALFCSVREIVWKRRLLAKLGEEQQGPTPL
ncbi:unnamed protein product [Closterium sp. NIES-54]